MTSMDIHIEFESFCDEAGYEIVTRDTPEADLRNGSVARRFFRDGMFLPAIVRKGGKLRRITPTKSNPDLYLELAALEPTPENYCAFAGRFGLLEATRTYTGRKLAALENLATEGEPLVDWASSIADMKEAVEVSREEPDGSWFDPKELFAGTETYMGTSPDYGPRLLVRPPTLLHAIQLQFAQAIVAKKDVPAWADTADRHKDGKKRR